MTDSIERTVVLDAPVERVWTALTDAQEFGTWFRLKLDGPFEAGKVTTGEVTYPGAEGLRFWARVKDVEEPRLFSFVWPYHETVSPDDPDIASKVTLVEFTLEASGEGTRLTVRESGFDKLPESRRLQAFRENQHGWKIQMGNIKSHVE
ncbi:SRPBCC family protein [Hoeflea sp. YIM 152468]|uniref:SRPBCC family protein n=1 Tax=Hoeflea sp. YIM 152468 TaxID=3031759 RepID=UPI0023DB4C34|nr:SRPBCC family protein [Hoeflea sp. YIM 152468]MDF1607833.1 SRPBCC family protein [Hoeflea sp. YIM 152468]